MKQFGELLDMPTLLLFIYIVKTEKSKLMYLYWKCWLWFIGFALVYCVGVNERENQISHIEMFQSNIYYYERIKLYIVSIQELCLQKTYQDVPRTNWKTCHKSQDSCACTRILCMHQNLKPKNNPCCLAGVRPPAVVFQEKKRLSKW